jgi:hypothetical protein
LSHEADVTHDFDIADTPRLLDWSPPSLYLFRQGLEPWNLPTDPKNVSEVLIKNIGEKVRDIPKIATNCYYIQFKQPESHEYSRSILIAG